MAMEDDPVPTVPAKQNFAIIVIARSGPGVHTTVIDGFLSRDGAEEAGEAIVSSERVKGVGLSGIAYVWFEKK